MTEPTTKTGRRLVDGIRKGVVTISEEDIFAIEAEAGVIERACIAALEKALWDTYALLPTDRIKYLLSETRITIALLEPTDD